MTKKYEIAIDFETADAITLQNLQHQIAILKKDLKKNQGEYHPEDFARQMNETVPAMATIIKYYGGSRELPSGKLGVAIKMSVADEITRVTLKDNLKMLKKEIKNHLEKGAWLHPEDLLRHRGELIPALKVLVKYWGG